MANLDLNHRAKHPLRTIGILKPQKCVSQASLKILARCQVSRIRRRRLRLVVDLNTQRRQTRLSHNENRARLLTNAVATVDFASFLFLFIIPCPRCNFTEFAFSV